MWKFECQIARNGRWRVYTHRVDVRRVGVGTRFTPDAGDGGDGDVRRLVEAWAEKADGGVHAHKQNRHAVLVIRRLPFCQFHSKADHVQPLWRRASSQPPPAEKSQNMEIQFCHTNNFCSIDFLYLVFTFTRALKILQLNFKLPQKRCFRMVHYKHRNK